jgi:3D (Asp-Asp-Asp) domain-containing protein
VLVGVSAAAAAGPSVQLHAQASALAARSHRALLDLYALDTRLHAAQSRLTALQSRAAVLRKQEAELSQQLGATRHTLTTSRRQLGANLSQLYKQDDVSVLAVVLGSRSLDDALTQLDDLKRFADLRRDVVQTAANAQSRLLDLQTTLTARRAALDASIAEAARTAAALESARNERLSFIAQLRRAERLKTAQIRALQAAAERVERKSDTLQAAASEQTSAVTTPAETSAPPPLAEGRTLTVSSTGYSLGGRTATGIPVGWGVVAVDPSVIPLGTRMTIPGYGEGVAADTGGAVRGATIDLWFPTLSQARAWGRRTVTITLH